MRMFGQLFRQRVAPAAEVSRAPALRPAPLPSSFSAMHGRISRRTTPTYLPSTLRILHATGRETVSFAQLLAHLVTLRPQTWLIEGLAGTGKTTAVEQLVLSRLERDVACVLVNADVLRQGWADLSIADHFVISCRPQEVDESQWSAFVATGW
jgi:hypothetical protein